MLGFIPSAFLRLPNFRGKHRAFKAVFSLLPFRAARSRQGVLLRKNVKDLTYYFCMTGSYGDFLFDILKSRSQKFCFLDIGANQGLFSVLAAKEQNCSRVVSIEPNPTVFSLLVQNIELNGIVGKVLPFCAAIASEGTTVLKFSMLNEHSGFASLCSSAPHSFLSINLNRDIIRDLLGIMAGAPVIVKIDVEGAESLVVTELIEADVNKQISCFVVEVSEQTAGGSGSAQRLVRLLNRQGWVETARCGDIDHYDALYERLK